MLTSCSTLTICHSKIYFVQPILRGELQIWHTRHHVNFRLCWPHAPHRSACLWCKLRESAQNFLARSKRDRRQNMEKQVVCLLIAYKSFAYKYKWILIAEVVWSLSWVDITLWTCSQCPEAHLYSQSPEASIVRHVQSVFF